MKKKYLFFVLLTTLLACNRCKDEMPEPTPTPEPDYYLPYLANTNNIPLMDMLPRSPLQLSPIMRGNLYDSPCFNPNNPYEIAYLVGDSITPEVQRQLYKFNFKTGKKTLLVPKAYQLTDWGKNGWLLYTGSDSQIWKIKENGDSAMRLTNHPDFSLYAEWSPNLQYFVYSTGLTTCVANPMGNLIKTMRTGGMNNLSWKNDSIVVYDNYIKVSTLNINTGEERLLREFGIAGVNTWQSNPAISYFAKQRGIGTFERRGHYGRHNYSTGQTDTLKILYDTYRFLPWDYSYVNQKLIGIVVTSEWVNDQSPDRYAWRKLLLIDPKTNEEKIIKIPE